MGGWRKTKFTLFFQTQKISKTVLLDTTILVILTILERDICSRNVLIFSFSFTSREGYIAQTILEPFGMNWTAHKTLHSCPPIFEVPGVLVPIF
jgi:hypothetical protein